MYGFDYTIASDEQSLSKGLATLYAQNEKPGLLVFTPTLENDAILQFFKELISVKIKIVPKKAVIF
jgi:2-succinyl-5-enolpyruvyl-6-hydroxy-3-cyclohexene-1-carboxylate synthase